MALLLICRASRPLISMLGADPALPNAYEDIGRQPKPCLSPPY
jgi:hypothetical protein